jgi:hypothetical protein
VEVDDFGNNVGSQTLRPEYLADREGFLAKQRQAMKKKLRDELVPELMGRKNIKNRTRLRFSEKLLAEFYLGEPSCFAIAASFREKVV